MKKPSLVKRFLLLASMMGAVTSFAQTTTIIDYNSLYATCNVFGTAQNVQGFLHKCNVGFQIGSYAVVMDGFGIAGSEYEIQYNFQAGHPYKIRVEGESSSIDASNNGTSATIRIEITDPSVNTNTNCSFSGAVPASSGPYQGTITFPFEDPITVEKAFNPTVAKSRLRVSFPSINAYLVNRVYIKKITIIDEAPVFNLVASSNTRMCGSANPVTFTVQNPGSAPVSQYKFYPESGKWLYNGNPAPAEIIVTPPTNSIVLTPVTCASNTSMSAKAVWNNQNVNMNAQSIAVTLPAYSVTGPSSLPMVSANYQLMGNPLILPTPPAGLPCNATVSWGNSNQSAAFLYVNTPTQVGISPNTQYPGFPVTIVLSAQIQACGQSTTVNRNITITDPFFAMPISGNSYQDNDNALTPWTAKSLSPNPTDGRFTIELSKSVMDASIYIRDITGSLVSTQKRSGQILNLDISSVSTGIYLVEIVSGNQSAVEKIIKK